MMMNTVKRCIEFKYEKIAAASHTNIKNQIIQATALCLLRVMKLLPNLLKKNL